MVAQTTTKTVESRRAFFERLYGCDAGRMRKTEQSGKAPPRPHSTHLHLLPPAAAMAPPAPPKKPQRTFAHDIYMETKSIVRSTAAGANRGPNEPEFLVKNVSNSIGTRKNSDDNSSLNKTGTAANAARRLSSAATQPAIARRQQQLLAKTAGGAAAASWKPPLPPKPTSPVHLKGRPRFFQLSHEYEQVHDEESERRRSDLRLQPQLNSTANCVCDRPSSAMKRSTSDDALYAAPCNVRSSRYKTMQQPHFPQIDQVYDTVPDSLYYASTEIGTLKKTISQNGIASAMTNKELPTAAERKFSPNKVSLSRTDFVSARRGSGSSLKQTRQNCLPTTDSSPYSAVHHTRVEASTHHRLTDRDSSDEELLTAENVSISLRPTTTTTTTSPDTTLKRRVTRARLVHRRTLAFYDQQAEAFCRRKAPQLFECALVVKLVPRDHAAKADLSRVIDPGAASCSRQPSSHIPVVTFRFPEEKNGSRRSKTRLGSGSGSIDPEALCPSLFYPDFSRATPYAISDHWPGDEEFIIILTNEVGERKFAYCIRYLARERDGDESEDERDRTDELTVNNCRNRSDSGLGSCSGSAELRSTLPEVLVLISPIQASAFYLALARQAVLYARQSLRRQLPRFFSAVFWKPFPVAPGSSLIIAEVDSASQLGRRSVICNSGAKIGRAGSAAMVSRMGVEQVVSVLIALLAEQRVLLAGEAVSSVTRAVQTLTSLLQPLSWPHTLVPVVPDSLLDLCHLPTPYFIGILRSNLDSLKELLVENNDSSNNNDFDIPLQDLVFVDLDYGVLVPRPDGPKRAMNTTNVWRQSSALALCERLGVPRKLTAELMRALRAAIMHNDGPVADLRVEEAVLSWFATLFGHYHHCVLQRPGHTAEFSTQHFLAAHSSKSARLFLEWFIATGIFQDWIRRRMEAMRNNVQPSNDGWRDTEDAANKRLDELAVTLAPGAILSSSNPSISNGLAPHRKLTNFVHRLLGVRRK